MTARAPLAGLGVAVLGLGEAGSAIAADLVAAGATVRGFDPAPVPDVVGVERHRDPVGVVVGADIVLAITAAVDAPTALEQALTHIPATAIYADLSTASPDGKREMAETARHLSFVDVALMSTVPGKGLFTPMLVSGPSASRFVELLDPAGVPVEIAGTDVGAAQTRKLLRSVVTKGMAALLLESMEAARAAGLEAEIWDNLIAQFTGDSGEFLQRLVTGTPLHATRRLHEMESSSELLRSLGVDAVMTTATVESLRRIAKA